MPQIIPIKDLKNTSEISDMCHKTSEPIYVTKNGYGDMVIMSMEIYESTMRQIAMYRDIEISEKQIEAGQVKDARTANVFARVEPEVKEQAEQVLDRLGIPMSNAVGMFLRQIVLQRGIPFEMKLPAYEEPVAYGSLTKEQFNAEIEKGMEDIKAGRVYSADEVEAEMKREFGI